MLPEQMPEPKGNGPRWIVYTDRGPWKFKGWTMAKPYGLYTHHLGATKPCCRRLTNDQVTCRGCRAGFAEVYKAYLPIYSPVLHHKVVLINRDEYDKVKLWETFTEVSVSKGKEYHAAVRIAAVGEGQLSQIPEWIERSSEVDLSCMLVKLWNIPELTNWWEDREAAEAAARATTSPSPPSPATKSPKAKRSKPHPDIPPVLDPATAEERAAMLARNRAKGLSFSDILDRTKPSENGTH